MSGKTNRMRMRYAQSKVRKAAKLLKWGLAFDWGERHAAKQRFLTQQTNAIRRWSLKAWDYAVLCDEIKARIGIIEVNE
jgi:hypothetical protein